MGMTAKPIAQRIHENVAIDPETGCWNWQLQLNEHGYGRIQVAGRPHRTHRVSYETFVGPIPAGLQLDHLCRNRACCNPYHLEPVTAKVNAHRSPLTPANATHCPKGHPYDDENTYLAAAKKGPPHRQRKICRRDWMREHHRRKAAVRRAADVARIAAETGHEDRGGVCRCGLPWDSEGCGFLQGVAVGLFQATNTLR